MNIASIDRLSGAVAPFAATRLLRGWAPLHTWSARRRRVVAGVIAVVACALATSTGMTTDFTGTAAADAGLAAARRELAEARRALRVLPALKRAALATPPGPPRAGNSADDARQVSELAASAGVLLVSLEPGAPGGEGAQGAEAFRTLKLTAQGGFAQLRPFLRGLAHAPALIAPTEATIRRDGSQLSLTATLSVFDALPSLPAIAMADDAATPPDPFGTNPADGARTGGGLRLAGMMQDRTHAIALIETPRGTEVVERGGRIEGASVARIAMREVTLSAGSTTRVLKWTEDGR